MIATVTDISGVRHEQGSERITRRNSPSAPGVRRIVQESWARSLQLNLNPDSPGTHLRLDGADLLSYRNEHILALALPTVQRLLVRHAAGSGLIIAVGDQDGRLMWIDGDRTLRRKAEKIFFVEGADWSEQAVGTSAPGTALALGRSVHIDGAEHFTRAVQPWNCTAVPIRDPKTRCIIGVIDITGGDDAIAAGTLPLLEATVAAIEAELGFRQLRDHLSRPVPGIHHAVSIPERKPTLSVLGSERGQLVNEDIVTTLSTRHAEILTLLAWHKNGLSAESLTTMLYANVSSTDTLRAEMVRLKKILGTAAPTLSISSRPYRLAGPMLLDACEVIAQLERGAHRVALSVYSGQALPNSTAPGIVAIRDEVSTQLREALLTSASVDTLLTYARTPEAALDLTVWQTCLTLLPARSPKRAFAVAQIEYIEAELDVPRK